MAQHRMKIYLIIFYYLLNSIVGSPHERRLLKHLFIEQEYNKFERPVQNDSEPVSVDIGLTLRQILDFDVKKQALTINAWLTMAWQDYSLIWKPEDYGNITTIRVPNTKIWIPDIVLYNSLGENCDNPTETNVVVKNTGDILYVSQRIFKSICAVDFASIPSVNTHSCSLKFASWTIDSSGVNLTTSNKEIDLSVYTNNSEWNLKNTSVLLTAEKYDCCQEIYQSIIFNIRIDRRSPHDFANVNGIKKKGKGGKFSNEEKQQNDIQE
jgi:hypothetical protein